MAKDYVYFDLETIHSANDVGGWNNKGDMKMSVGVTYSTVTGKYIAYPEHRVDELIRQLMKADLVIGFNHIKFDYAVLEGYQPICLDDQCISLDLMVSVEQEVGHRMKLDAIASASLGAGKTAQGLDAIKWWREGKYREVAEYCCYDVKVTRLVHEFGAKNGFVRYDDKFGNAREAKVDWQLP
jgi:DEAD/DEAH box helicase domain-containing protein